MSAFAEIFDATSAFLKSKGVFAQDHERQEGATQCH